jgi:hypothetical protein
VKRFLETPTKLDQMGLNSKKIFDRGYDNEQVIAFTLDAYRKALSSPRA